MFNNFYRHKKVLVTGDSGFKGSWLCLWLLSLGADVIGYSLPPHTNPSLFEATLLEKKIKHFNADIRDEEKLTAVILEEKPEIIFHLAAQALVRYSYAHPKETYETNVLGTINLFEAVRRLDKEVILINVTSDKCYENIEQDYHYKEDDPLGGFDPYSNSKGCSELVTSSYRRSFFNPNNYAQGHHVALGAVRAGNVIGGGDWAEHRIIPDCMRALSSNQKIALKSPDSIRPWQFVLEPLSGYLKLASVIKNDIHKFATAWNFGPNDEDSLKVEDIVAKVVRFWGSGSYFVNRPDNLHEANLLQLDITKARKDLNWQPVYSADEAVAATVAWYQKFYQEHPMSDFSLEQIKQYQARREANEL